MIDKNGNENGFPLPEAFCRRMKGLLGQEYEAFADSYEKERSQGLRLNPIKLRISGERKTDGTAVFSQAVSQTGSQLGSPAAPQLASQATPQEAVRQKLRRQFGLRPIPWTADGYYYEAETRPGRHPYHEAGLYYIQEPSAMAVAELLNPQPGERILDLCAAPGGKSTQIAGKMKGKGLLVSNEIHPERARILSQNIERMGIGNAIVTNETPERLSKVFYEFFDKVLVDAPCSGEGMFRKDEASRQEWSPEHVNLCARRQAGILDCAARMLRPGGRLVYSTCTFAPEENEGSIWNFLKRHREFSIEKPNVDGTPVYKGFSQGRPEWLEKEPAEETTEELTREAAEETTEESAWEAAEEADRVALAETIRLWPHKVEGEGHYIAILRKAGPENTGRTGAGVSAGEIAARTGAGKKSPASKKKDSDGLGTREKEVAALWNSFCMENLNGNPAEDGGRPLFPCKQSTSDTMFVFPCKQGVSDAMFVLFGEQLYLLPEPAMDLRGLKVLRPGLHLGTIKKNRLEPSHALALWLKKEQVKRWYSLPAESAGIERYLRGETLEIAETSAGSGQNSVAEEKPIGTKESAGGKNLAAAENLTGNDGMTGNGWVLILADGWPIGWAKQVGTALKNHYPKGLRKN